MTYSHTFKTIYPKINYVIINKMYYRTKPFKISYSYYAKTISKEVFEVFTFSLIEPHRRFKNFFATEKEMRCFYRTLMYGNYVKTEQEVIWYITTLKHILDKIGNNSYITTLTINGPLDPDHLTEISNLKSGKKTEISGIKLKEVLSPPTHNGYKYMIRGRYLFSKQPTDMKSLTDEVKMFTELFGGEDNENIMFTGSIKSILSGDQFVMSNSNIRYHLNGKSNGISFTIHYKDHGELISLNFMKRNVFITSAVEFMK
jgi:hypothetical protein